MKFDYIIEEIESVEQLENFDNEYVYDLEIDDDTHTFIANDILVHNSVYTTYGEFFNCMTPEWHKRYPTREDKIKWIVKFNQEYMDEQNTEWIKEMYAARNAKSIHSFEMETAVNYQLNLAKKKYLKAIKWEKGHMYDHDKIKGTGIELARSTTPPKAKEILTKLLNHLIYDYSKMTHDEFVYFFADKLNEYKKEFYAANVDDISQSIGVNGYKKFVIDDENALQFNKGATPGVKGCARYNYLAHKNGEDDKRIYSGKMKYYNIRINAKTTDFFAYPFGECPKWAPRMDYGTQWDKTVIQPINRFLEVMKIPLANIGGIQIGLFGESDFG